MIDLNEKLMQNILFIIAGIVLLIVFEFKIINTIDIVSLIGGFIGLILLLEGIYESYKIIKVKN